MFRYYFRKNTHLFLIGQKEMIEKTSHKLNLDEKKRKKILERNF